MKRRVLLPLLVAVLFGSLLSQPASAAPGGHPHGGCTSVPYTSGTEGYHTFRIPAVIRTLAGTLIAFAEGRVESAGDSGAIQIVQRRSFDGGCTWGPMSVVTTYGDATAGNPAPVVLPTGEIVLLSTTNGRVSESEIMSGTVSAEDSRRVWVQRSRTNGRTWTDPREITSVAKKADWRWYATGPGHAIMLKSGKHAGRIVVPANHSVAPPAGSPDVGTEQRYYGGHSLLSDDWGRTWRIGFTEDLAADDIASNETTVAQLPNGKLYFNSRNQGTIGGRVDGYSTDGGETLAAPYAAQPTLTIPKVQASVLQTSRPNLLLFAGPSDATARRAMAVRASSDGGRTWEVVHTVSNDPAAYSDLVQLSRSTVGLLYETGAVGSYETITFTQLSTRDFGKTS